MAQMHARQREAEATTQEMYLKKMHSIKTNSTVEHLWQVKRVEYAKHKRAAAGDKGQE
jgi:hypothetical protein